MTDSMVHLTSRVPRDLPGKLDEVARQRRMQTGENVSRADVVRQALEAVTDRPEQSPDVDASWDNFGRIAIEVLEGLEAFALECGVEDAQDMAMTLAVAADEHPRRDRLAAFVGKLHGALNSG